MSSKYIRKVTVLLKIQSCYSTKAEGTWWRKVMHIIKVYLHVYHLALQINPTGIIHFTSNANESSQEKEKVRRVQSNMNVKKDRAAVPLIFSIDLSYSLKILAF